MVETVLGVFVWSRTFEDALDGLGRCRKTWMGLGHYRGIRKF